MAGMSSADPGPGLTEGLDADEFAALLINEDDPARRMELFHEYMQRRRSQTYARASKRVKHPGQKQNTVQGRKVPLQGSSAAPKTGKSPWPVKVTSWCTRCGALLNEQTSPTHIEWHNEERERLLAIAVELLGVLGGLDGSDDG